MDESGVWLGRGGKEKIGGGFGYFPSSPPKLYHPKLGRKFKRKQVTHFWIKLPLGNTNIQHYAFFTTAHFWCDDHFTNISICGVWEVRVRIQIFKRELHTTLFLVSFLSFFMMLSHALICFFLLSIISIIFYFVLADFFSSLSLSLSLSPHNIMPSFLFVFLHDVV